MGSDWEGTMAGWQWRGGVGGCETANVLLLDLGGSYMQVLNFGKSSYTFMICALSYIEVILHLNISPKLTTLTKVFKF